MRIKYDVQTSEGEIIRSHNAISTRYQTSKPPGQTGRYRGQHRLEGKVDKADGKGLSTNDFTNAYKSVADCMVYHDSVSSIAVLKQLYAAKGLTVQSGSYG